MSALSAAESQRATITNGVEYLVRLVDGNECRAHRASDAVAYVCSEIQRYLDDPDGVGTDVLAAARLHVLQQHAGNFGPTFAKTT